MSDRSIASWTADDSLWRPADRRSLALGIAIAILGPLLATPISVSLLEQLPALVYYPVIGVATWFGRCLAGAVALVVSTLALAYWSLEPVRDLRVDEAGLLIGYLALSGATVGIVSMERRSRARAELASARLGYLGDAMLAVESEPDRDAALRALATYLVPSFASWCAVHAVEPSDGTIVPVAVAHTDPSKVELARQLQERYPVQPDAPDGVAAAIREGREQFIPVIDESLLEHAPIDEERRELVRALDLRSAIVVPMIARGRAFGAITLVNEGAHRSYDLADLETARELARRVAVSLDTLTALDEAKRSADRARSLQRVMSGVSRSMNSAVVLETVLSEVVRELGARGVLIALLDGSATWLEIEAFHGYDPANIARWERFAVTAPLPMSEAVRRTETLVIRDLEERTRRYPALDPNEGRPDHTLICAPLLQGEVPMGGIAISLDGVREPTAAEMEFLDAVTRQAGASIRRARLFEERSRTAAVLQEGLVPRAIPAIAGARLAAGYHPASEFVDVGGDFYDVLVSPSGPLAIIGDVCGRGVEAASLMAVARYAAWGAAMRGADPAAVLATVDRVLQEREMDDRFVTMVAARFQPTPSGIRYTLANGGHPAPVAIGTDIVPLGEHGPLLGVIAGAEFPTSTGEISLDEALLLYTDGVVERTGRHVPLHEDDELGPRLTAADRRDPVSIVTIIEETLTRAGPKTDDSAFLAIVGAG